MSNFTRKVKRNKEKKEAKVDKWEDLMQMRSDCINSYIDQHTLLITIGKQFKDQIENDKIVSQIFKGVNDSLVEISKKIKINMDRHVMPTDKKDEAGNIIFDYKKGVVDPDGEEILEYWNIANEYMIINNDILGVGTDGYITLLDELRAFTNAIKEEDITMLRKAVDNGQNEIIKTIQGAHSGKRSKAKRK